MRGMRHGGRKTVPFCNGIAEVCQQTPFFVRREEVFFNRIARRNVHCDEVATCRFLPQAADPDSPSLKMCGKEAVSL